MESERSTTAVNLWRFLDDTNVYLNHHTRDDYGFSRCTSIEETRELMNVYRLIKESGVGPNVMYDWLRGGTLHFHLGNHLGRIHPEGIEPRHWVRQHPTFFRAAGMPLPRSVWELMRYVEGLSPTISESVQSDYGFSNCSDDMERGQLKNFYETNLPRFNPYDLEDACLRNTIAEYAESVLGFVNPLIASQYLKNDYPRRLELEDWERVPVEEE